MQSFLSIWKIECILSKIRKSDKMRQLRKVFEIVSHIFTGYDGFIQGGSGD